MGGYHVGVVMSGRRERFYYVKCSICEKYNVIIIFTYLFAIQREKPSLLFIRFDCLVPGVPVYYPASMGLNNTINSPLTSQVDSLSYQPVVVFLKIGNCLIHGTVTC